MPEVVTQWDGGTTRESNPGPRARIPSTLTTKPLSMFVVSDGAAPCGSVTVSATSRGQSRREGLYELESSSNSSSCNGRPVWKSRLIDSWIHYSTADSAWYITDVNCSDTAVTDGMNLFVIAVLITARAVASDCIVFVRVVCSLYAR